MKRNFTFDDLLLYHYGELPIEEVDALEACLLFDEHLIESNETIMKMMGILDAEKISPSQASIQIILAHNRKSSGELEAI